MDNSIKPVTGLEYTLPAGESKAPSGKGGKQVSPSIRDRVSSSGKFGNAPALSGPGSAATGPKISAGPKAVDPAGMIRADLARERFGVSGKGQTAVIIDTGFERHGIKLKHWEDFSVEKSPAPVDHDGHGTHVAGDLQKIAPQAKIVALKIFDREGFARQSALIEALQWSLENKDRCGIGVINISLETLPNDSLSQALAKVHRAGITVVVGAGNGYDRIFAPADSPHAITVASARDEKTVSSFSKRGGAELGAPRPDLAAPGENIEAWVPPDSQMMEKAGQVDELRGLEGKAAWNFVKSHPKVKEEIPLPVSCIFRSGEKKGAYAKEHLPQISQTAPGKVASCGTSFASPLVAGVALLLKEADPGLTPEQVGEILKRSARPMGKGFSSRDRGAGFVDAEKALELALERKEKKSALPGVYFSDDCGKMRKEEQR